MILQTAERTLLAPFDLERRKLERVFGTLAARKVDYADLYFQYSRYEGWSLEEGIVKSGSFNIEQGVGVRAHLGREDRLRVLRRDQPAARCRTRPRRRAPLRPPVRCEGSRSNQSRTSGRRCTATSIRSPRCRRKRRSRCCERLERKCRALDPRVTQVMASLGGEYEVVLIARSRRRASPRTCGRWCGFPCR